MQISNSEKILMDALWHSSPMSAKQIIDSIEKSLNWHDKTVKTLLNRLLKKEAVGFNKQGREYFYFPLIAEKDYVEIASESFLQRVFKGNVSSLVATFAKKEKLSDKDIAELKQLIKEIEND